MALSSSSAMLTFVMSVYNNKEFTPWSLRLAVFCHLLGHFVRSGPAGREPKYNELHFFLNFTWLQIG